MAKKVTLDTLDIEETSVSLRDEPAEIKTEEDKPRVRWFDSIWLRVSCIAFLILFCIISLSYWWISSKKPVPPASVQKVIGPAPFRGTQNIECVNDFYIPLKAEKEDQRIMMFDLAFELNTGKQDLLMGNMVRIRSSIYQIVSKKTVNVALSPGGMNLLRDEIMTELENYLGKGSIKNIYFTRYIVL
jgi:flagellar basal body-associated protein FliL